MITSGYYNSVLFGLVQSNLVDLNHLLVLSFVFVEFSY